MSIIVTILIFGFIVLIHEYGHFIVAKKSGVFIEEFAIGMGPRIISNEKNGTIYSIRILPLGGFCKMKGEDAEDTSPDSFNNISVFKKILIVFAGPLMNFLLALIIFTGFSFINGITTTTVKETLDNYPAQEIGIQSGDIIYKINGKKVNIYDDISYYLSKYSKDTINIEVKRNGEILTFNLNPEYSEDSYSYILGIYMVNKSSIFSNDDLKVGFFESIIDGFYNMIFMIKITLAGILDIITLNVSLDSLVGPIGLVPIIGETYETALSYSFSTMLNTMLNLTALLSANIGIMNLLPIPALDGGRLIFLFIEAIRGKNISQEKESLIHFIGFAVLMLFGLFIAVKDIIRIF